MKIEEICRHVMNRFRGLTINKNWGERGLFYNPENKLPLGAYMLTFKEKDGANDSSSRINRSKNYFRLNMKISKATFIRLFDSIPKRPPAGGVVETGHDFTQLDQLMPHPVYGWMTWICVLNPSLKTIEKMEELKLFDEAYHAASETFHKKTGTTLPKKSMKRHSDEVDNTQKEADKIVKKKPHPETVVHKERFFQPEMKSKKDKSSQKISEKRSLTQLN